jgi:hypothetical protein
MNLFIRNYHLTGAPTQVLVAPDGWRFLCITLVAGEPYLWVLQDNNKPDISVQLLTVQDAAQVPDAVVYLGSYQTGGSDTVNHVLVQMGGAP